MDERITLSDGGFSFLRGVFSYSQGVAATDATVTQVYSVHDIRPLVPAVTRLAPSAGRSRSR